MQISTEGKIGLALGLFALVGAAIGLVGAGMQMLAPAYTQIGWILIVSGGITFTVAIIGAVALTFHHFGIGRQKMSDAIGIVVDLRSRVEPIHIIILGLAIACGGVVWQFYQGYACR